MIRSDIIHKLSQQHPDIPEHVINAAISDLVDYMRSEIAHGKRIEVRDFGAFELRYRPPRNVSDPRTQAHHTIDARFVAHFRAGQELRAAVQKGMQQGLPIKND